MVSFKLRISFIHSALDSMMAAIPEPCSEHRRAFKTNPLFLNRREIVGVILFFVFTLLAPGTLQQWGLALRSAEATNVLKIKRENLCMWPEELVNECSYVLKFNSCYLFLFAWPTKQTHLKEMCDNTEKLKHHIFSQRTTEKGVVGTIGGKET